MTDDVEPVAPMRFAYADPPYPGCAGMYVENREVNHRVLFGYLCEHFPDGWAMSTASTTLAELLRMDTCPRDVRICSWVKPFASFKPGVNPGYCWEPVLLWRGRRRTDKTEPTVRDYLAQSITLRKGLTGAKHAVFCRWVANLLGYRHGVDDLVDVFPGTGIMDKVLDQGTLL